jgi:cell fate regulator YaaT (PSP1 superfamily)
LPERKALRLATEKDRGLSKDLDNLNEEARRKAMERVRANNLGMKLSDAEWQWDRKKLTLYFTADKRVDFRNLVRDLASLFRTRIELKQIGVRDEAKRLDGIGRCGRQYCSASWLPELRPVNLGVAKDQRLSLNPSQISGACGRLMCCLRYEHEFYVQSRKRFPKEGKIVVTTLGEEKVASIDIFHERVTLRGVEGDMRSLTLAEFKVETEQHAGAIVQAASAEDEEIQPEEISPDLMYTAEHPVFTPRVNVIAERPPAKNGNAQGSDGPGKRRRGRRGGRRGRGDDSPSGSQ